MQIKELLQILDAPIDKLKEHLKSMNPDHYIWPDEDGNLIIANCSKEDLEQIANNEEYPTMDDFGTCDINDCL